MESGGGVTGRAGAVVLDRAALVVHELAVTLTAGRLFGTIDGCRRNLVAMVAIASLGEGGGVVGIGPLMAIGTDLRVTGGLMTGGAVPTPLGQRRSVVNLGNRRGVASLAAAPLELDAGVTEAAIAGDRFGTLMMLLADMATAADNTDRFGSLMAGNALSELPGRGGMVAWGQSGGTGLGIVTGGTIHIAGHGTGVTRRAGDVAGLTAHVVLHRDGRRAHLGGVAALTISQHGAGVGVAIVTALVVGRGDGVVVAHGKAASGADMTAGADQVGTDTDVAVVAGFVVGRRNGVVVALRNRPTGAGVASRTTQVGRHSSVAISAGFIVGWRDGVVVPLRQRPGGASVTAAAGQVGADSSMAGGAVASSVFRIGMMLSGNRRLARGRVAGNALSGFRQLGDQPGCY